MCVQPRQRATRPSASSNLAGHSMSIRAKLTVILATILVAGLAAALYAVSAKKHATTDAVQLRDLSTEIVVAARAAQLHFKKQVQEWKNILLRGHEPPLYDKYLAQFYEEEENTRRAMRHLLPLLSEDSKARKTAKEFLEAHTRLGGHYREALQFYSVTTSNPHIVVDMKVRGIDRQPTDLLDKVVESTLTDQEVRLAEIEKSIVLAEREIVMISLGMLVTAVVLMIWFTDRAVGRPIAEATEIARRISDGDLNATIEVKARDEAGQLLRAMRTMQDSVAASQGKLQEQRALLAQRVEERTEELHLANSELARAARAKDEFLAAMSHELRTPLTTVMGIAEMMVDQRYGPVTEKQTRALGTVEESARHLLDLINDVLDVAKVEAGKMHLAWDEVPVEQLVEASIRLLRNQAQSKGLEIRYRCDPRVLTVHCDNRRLKQILVNLLGNAVKFTPEGGKIDVQVEADVDKQVVHFIVTDTGIGIPSDQLSRLFKPFVQLDSALARQYPGTGLGLTLVFRMAELHGGSVSVNSEPGKGSTFSVALPWSADAQPVSHVDPLESGAVIEARGTENYGVTILLAEDNEANATMLTEFFSVQGYRVVVAQDGEEAVELAERHHPDIVLMDIQMPNVDGLEATRRIRQRSGPEQLPIVALTALAMPGDRELCLEAGADEYLSKPVGLHELHTVIQRRLALIA